MSKILGFKVFKNSGKILFTVLEDGKSTDKVESFGLGYPFITKTGFVQGAWGIASDFDLDAVKDAISDGFDFHISYDYRGNITALSVDK